MDEATGAAAGANLARVRGSRTAEAVAAFRALHLLRHSPPWVVEDPLAIHFAGAWRRIVNSRVLSWIYTRVILRRLAPVAMEHLTRTRFAEDRIASAVERGMSQLVILGAGFDTFALRNPHLPATVFEVDLAATQAIKRKRMQAAGLAPPAGLRFVTVDFERDDLGARLAASGFIRGRPGFFNWMGVTYYLAADALRDTLGRLGELAAPGSELTLDYLIAEESLPEDARPALHRLKRFVARSREPLVSAFQPESLPNALGVADDWEVAGHDAPAEQAAQYLSGRSDLPPLAPLFGCLHLRRKPASERSVEADERIPPDPA